MVAKTIKKRPSRRSDQRVRPQPVREVLYDRVTGRTQQVEILPTASRPSTVTVRLRTDQRARLDQEARKIARTTGQALWRSDGTESGTVLVESGG